MMDLIINLPPDIEAKLNEQARAAGKPPEAVVLQVLRDELEGRSIGDVSLTAEEWIADLYNWAKGHKRLPHDADDSRESIYAGRGE